MTIAEPVRAPLEDARVNYVQWGPAIAGALIATAVALCWKLRRCHRTCGDLHRAHLARLFGGAAAALGPISDPRGYRSVRRRWVPRRAYAKTRPGQSR